MGASSCGLDQSPHASLRLLWFSTQRHEQVGDGSPATSQPQPQRARHPALLAPDTLPRRHPEERRYNVCTISP
eukprot:scaffold5043_cov115-Isochrysis_galbana.AAC.1